jgi:hypothetical protein
MTPQITAIIILGLGILTVATWQLWRPLRNVGRDVGLNLFAEDPSDDLEAVWRLPAQEKDGAQ